MEAQRLVLMSQGPEELITAPREGPDKDGGADHSPSLEPSSMQRRRPRPTTRTKTRNSETTSVSAEARVSGERVRTGDTRLSCTTAKAPDIYGDLSGSAYQRS